MRDQEIQTAASPPVYGPQLLDTIACLLALMLDGLAHGFFDYTVSCEIGGNGRRHVVISAGKSHKFTIPADELPRPKGRQR